MFCKNCGTENLEQENESCQFCGEAIADGEKNNYLTEHRSLKRKDLENKAWFRFVKVLYIVNIVIAIITIGGISWSAKPQKTLDGNLSSISCNNGKFYAPNRNSIYPYSWETDLSYSNDENARILCRYDTLNFYSHSNEAIEKNYTFIPIYNDVKYGSWIGYIILAFCLLWLFTYLIKIGFFYIVIGERP